MKRKAYIWVARDTGDTGTSYVLCSERPCMSYDDGVWLSSQPMTIIYPGAQKPFLLAGMPDLEPGGGPVKCEIVLKPVKKEQP